MELNVDEALRYLGIRGVSPEGMRHQVEEVAAELTAALRPRYVFRLFPLVRTGRGWLLEGAGLELTGRSAEGLLSDCGQAALLACTLGAEFDRLLRREQARDMGRAAILDACGSAWVEAGCDGAEEDLRARLPGRYLTDRFSPGYGDLPLTLQPGLCDALDTRRRLGLSVTDSLLMVPVKSVTAVIGVADRPQMARVRGCEHCPMGEKCELRKGGKSCAL